MYSYRPTECGACCCVAAVDAEQEERLQVLIPLDQSQERRNALLLDDKKTVIRGLGAQHSVRCAALNASCECAERWQSWGGR